MLRHLFVLALVVALVTMLAVLAAVSSSSQEAEAQVTPRELNYLCLEIYTGIYRGSFSASCPPSQQLLTLPDAYPLSLCVGRYDRLLRRPLANNQCPGATLARIELPSETPVNVCLDRYTGRLRAPVPYPNGGCGNNARLVTFAMDLSPRDDLYQTLGNVDIDVPAGAGVLANDPGSGLTVTGFQNPSANGGAVTLNPDGSFTYVPPEPDPGAFIGADSFTYDVEDGDGNTGTATVTIQVSAPAVWFVDADAEENGDGRRVSPFNEIQELNDDGNDPDIPGDVIFLYEADTAYLASFVLEEGQTLVGQEVDLAEILEQILSGQLLSASGSSLQGAPNALPPHLVLPEENPGEDVPRLVAEDGSPALEMADDSAAAGVWIEATGDAGVLGEFVTNTLLDRVVVLGSTDSGGDGTAGVILDDAEMTIRGSEIRGGNGELGGDGGPGVASLGFGFGFSLTVTDASEIYGGDGADDLDGSGGYGGEGIVVEPFFFTGAAGPAAHTLQGDVDEAGPTITVSGGSTVGGGAGGNGLTVGGDGGGGILAFLTVISVTEGSTVYGGAGGEGGEFGGDGGIGLANIGEFAFLGSGGESGSALLGLEERFVILQIDGSTVNGGDGGTGAGFGGYGGEAVLIPFLFPSGAGAPFVLAFDITNSTITAGDGAAAVGGAVGLSAPEPALQGDLGEGGSGGVGILGFFLIDDFDQGEQLQIEVFVSNTIVQGGAGGDDVFFPGSGGPGIVVFGADTIINQQSSVTGGTAGMAGNMPAGGGPGIVAGFPFIGPFGFDDFGLDHERYDDRLPSLQGNGSFPFKPGSLTVDGSSVTGGAGAGSDGLGFSGAGILGFGGFSGRSLGTSLEGLDELEPTIVNVSNSTVSGGDGIDNTGGAAADGGVGLLVFGTLLTIDTGSQITGGDGGSGELSGFGGPGIVAAGSETLVDGSTVTGGAGGDGVSSDGGGGGTGIATIGCPGCNTLAISNNSMVSGGAGGMGLMMMGGAGGPGIYAEDDNVAISDSTVSGGLPGEDGSGRDLAGPGGVAVEISIISGGSHTANITNSALNGAMGFGGQADSLLVTVSDGSICVNAAGNSPTGDFTLDQSGGTLGITQADPAALSADNNGVTINATGTITFGCAV